TRGLAQMIAEEAQKGRRRDEHEAIESSFGARVLDLLREEAREGFLVLLLGVFLVEDVGSAGDARSPIPGALLGPEPPWGVAIALRAPEVPVWMRECFDFF